MRKIKTFGDLDGLENERYIIQVDFEHGIGLIISKNNRNDFRYYLSTYEINYRMSIKELDMVLSNYGFNVELESWG